MEILYEKDLRAMKFHILTSTRHHRVVTDLAARLGLPVQEMRRHLIRRLDMQHLENLPARYDAWMDSGGGDPLERALAADILTVSIPLFPSDDTRAILAEVRGTVEGGGDPEAALSLGRARLREVIRS
jgi:energy-converting hydrogenase A subunit M